MAKYPNGGICKEEEGSVPPHHKLVGHPWISSYRFARDGGADADVDAHQVHGDGLSNAGPQQGTAPAQAVGGEDEEAEACDRFHLRRRCQCLSALPVAPRNEGPLTMPYTPVANRDDWAPFIPMFWKIWGA